MLRWAGTALALVLFAGMAPAAAGAAPRPSWTRPVALERDCHRCIYALSGLAADGSSVVVWSQHGGAFSRVRRTDGRPGPRQQLVVGPPHRPLAVDAFAAGPDGTTAIVWDDGRHLLARVRLPDGTLGAVQVIDADVIGNSDNDVLFGPADGRARVLAGVFPDQLHGKAGGYFITTLDAGAGPGERMTLDDGHPAERASVAVDGVGDAIVAWQEDSFSFAGAGAGARVLARTISRDGAVGPTLTVSGQTAPGLLEPIVSVSTGGRGHVLWSEDLGLGVNPGGSPGPGFTAARLMERPIDVHGTLGAAATISPRIDSDLLDFGRRPGGAQLSAASLPDGTTVVAWAQARRLGHYDRVRVEVIGAQGPRRPGTLSPRTDAEVSAPSVAAHGRRALVAWRFGIRTGSRFGPPGLTRGLAYGVHARWVSSGGSGGRTSTILAPRRGVSVFDPMLAADARARHLLLTWIEFLRDRPRRIMASALRG